MSGKQLTIVTHHLSRRSPDVMWKGITNAVMTYPRPFCFNLGVPLPLKCEITGYADGRGTNRRCTSDKGFIDQTITAYVPNVTLAFSMRSHNLRTRFTIGQMDDEFTFAPMPEGLTRLTRKTQVEVPAGCAMAFRCWAIRRSIHNVHRYVYSNIEQGD
jgi:hypothetical protein